MSLDIMTKCFDKVAWVAAPLWPHLCLPIESDGMKEYATLDGLPTIKKWLADRKADSLRAGRFALMSRKSISDQDKLLFEQIVAGATSECWDNQYFYDHDHRFGDSASQSNLLTYRAINPTAVKPVEFKESFKNAVSQLTQYVDDNRNPLNQSVAGTLNDLVVLVPTKLRQQAHMALESEYSVGPRIFTSAALTSAVTWYLFNTGAVVKPFIGQLRKPTARQSLYAIGYLGWWTSVLTEFT